MNLISKIALVEIAMVSGFGIWLVIHTYRRNYRIAKLEKQLEKDSDNDELRRKLSSEKKYTTKIQRGNDTSLMIRPKISRSLVHSVALGVTIANATLLVITIPLVWWLADTESQQMAVGGFILLVQFSEIELYLTWRLVYGEILPARLIRR